MQIINCASSKVIFEESTGKWLAVTDEGVDIYLKYYKDTIINDPEIADFVYQVNSFLGKKDFADETEKGLTVLLTNQCNFECVHCFYNSSCMQPEYLAFDETYRSFIHEYKKSGLKNITFTGGEPLLNPDFKKFVEHAAKNNINIFVLTNGSLITDELAQMFADYGVKVQVSLDGTGKVYERMRQKAKYETTVNGINILREHKVQTDISFVPCKITLADFENVVSFAMNNRINLLHMPFLERYGRAEDNYDELFVEDDTLITFLKKIIEKYFAGEYGELKIGFIDNIKDQLMYPVIKDSCKACKGLILSIDYAGKIYPCAELITDEFCLGRTEDGLDQIHETFLGKMKRLTQIDVTKINKCCNCVYRNLCGGGCRLQALLSGGLYEPDRNCEVIKAIYSEILDKIIQYEPANDK